jgi:lipopolysaccharide/colanic/teichoic acid biosynthesis glycosyltransferase
LPGPYKLRLASADSEAAPGVERSAGARARREPRPVPAIRIQPLRAWYLPCKYALDFVLALVLTIPALPVVLLSALIVRLTSRGPAFYTQVRVGANGRPFKILKVRTMVHNCESLTGPRWAIPGDPRVTRFGQFLRISHLDELPQLINVLRGEMSLIGPRPERPEYLPELEEALPAYAQRLRVRPGVTGLAQVHLPADSDLHSVERKLAHDLFYVRHVSPWLDFRLLLCTTLFALGVPFAWSSRMLRIPDTRRVDEAMADVVEETRRRAA